MLKEIGVVSHDAADHWIYNEIHFRHGPKKRRLHPKLKKGVNSELSASARARVAHAP
jgi:hypothetical protein